LPQFKTIDRKRKKAITLPRKTLIVVPPIEYTRRTTNSGGYIPLQDVTE
jgi:hypothetical protein